MMQPVSSESVRRIRAFMRGQSAVVLSDDKDYLVAHRLAPVARAAGYRSVDEMVAGLERADASLKQRIVDALTTNETYFFRDGHPFEALRETIFPELFHRLGTGAPVRVWSAGCSSGQEAYSVAMLLDRYFAGFARNVDLVATDVSGSVIERARSGRFSNFEISRGLEEHYRESYFRQDGSNWVLRQRIRDMVEFEQQSVFDQTARQRFHVVLLRYVLIYFDDAAKARAFERVERAIAPGGYLMLGASESAFFDRPGWIAEQVGPTIVHRRAE
jgi:chemotaxis protein methyltransferase CheR